MPYVEPSSVPCGHVFCATCLSTHITQTTRNGRALCPACRQEFQCDPQMIPPIINPHVLPSIRRIFIDTDTSEIHELKDEIDKKKRKISELKRQESALRKEFETYKKNVASTIGKMQADADEFEASRRAPYETLSKSIKVILDLGTRAEARPRPSSLAEPSRNPRDTNTRPRSFAVPHSHQGGASWR
ncbi:hypothetical protein BDZ89DRAFT_1084094 [Hymenopellis radicata]|nr:hypothetical protein BDZ89DRAFT_1084094 [Hymenopellis radicata]